MFPYGSIFMKQKPFEIIAIQLNEAIVLVGYSFLGLSFCEH